MNWNLLPSCFVALITIAAPCLAQSPDTAAAPTPKPFQWNAEFDGYSDLNFNNPDSETNAYRAFDTHANAFRVGATTVDLDYKFDRWSAHLTGGYGELYHVMGYMDQLKGANSYLSQYFVGYRPIKDSSLEIDFGKFYTSVGAEVPRQSE